MQAISGGKQQIEIGSGERRVAVNTAPLEWECPVSIDLEALERVGDFQEELAAMRFFDDEEDDDEQISDNEEIDPDE
jgi:hypothetical protein